MVAVQVERVETAPPAVSDEVLAEYRQVVAEYATARRISPLQAARALNMPPAVILAEAPRPPSYAEAQAMANRGPRCNYWRRLDDRRAHLCSRPPGHKGPHVSGAQAHAEHYGTVEGGRPEPVPVTASRWLPERPLM